MKSAYKVILWGLCGLLLSSIFLRTILAVKSDWATRMKNPLQTALSLPELKNSHGIITGNAESPYPGLIAYFLKREFWNSIRDENSEELVERLKRWHVSQVIWVGKPSTELEKISWLRKLGPYGEAENAFYIYNVIGSEPENSAK